MIHKHLEGLTIHPAANIFPLMDGETFAGLVADIKANDQREPCAFYKGELIDGRNRWIACKELGIEPETAEFEGDDFDPVAYVLSVNLHRRHLDESQRAMVAAKVKEIYKSAAKSRMIAGGKSAGNGRPKKGKDNCPTPTVQARDEAGKALNVSGKTVDRAATVLKHGSDDLIAAVEQGEVAVSRAAEVAKTTPKEQQLQAAKEKPKRERKAKSQDECPKGGSHSFDDEACAKCLEPAPSKSNASSAFDDTKIDEAIRHLQKLINERYAAFGHKDGFESCCEEIDRLIAAFGHWQALPAAVA